MAKRSKSNPVLVFTKSPTTEIRCEISEFKGKPMLNMREWWGDSDDDTDDYKPGKGFTIPITKAAEFLSELATWAAEVEVPDAPAGEIKKKSRVVTKDGDEGVVVKIKGEFAFVVMDGDDDDEETRIKLSKLELAPEKKAKKKKVKEVDLDDEDEDEEDEDEAPKKSKKKSKKSANEEADAELADLEDDEPKAKKKSSKKASVKKKKK